MTGTDLCVNKSQFVPVIFEPPCTNLSILKLVDLINTKYATKSPESSKNYTAFTSQIFILR
jgi:hypothetical protein